MNYKKLIDSTLSNHQDKSLTAFAGLIGLATGAAIAVLFAPDSGKRSRTKLSTAVRGLFGQFRKNNTATTAESDDQQITDLRETVREHASQLEGSESNRKDPTKITIPSAGTTNWKKQLIEE